MKLDFESNISALPYFDSDSANEINEENISSQSLGMLRDGIKAAREGNRADAKTLLLQVAEAEPHNEEAWFYLASISEYPEELLICLNNVLSINPENRRALEWSKATKSVLAKTFVQRGIDACGGADLNFSKQCLLQAIVCDDENETAWFRLASLADSNEEKILYLNKVLKINAEHEDAQNQMVAVKREVFESLLRKANHAAISGDKASAEKFIGEILEQSPELEGAWVLKCHLAESLDEKVSCYQNVLQINPDNEAAKAGLASLQAIMSQVDEEEFSAPQNAVGEIPQAETAAEEEVIPEPEVNFEMEVAEENSWEMSEPENFEAAEAEMSANEPEISTADAEFDAENFDADDNDYSLDLEVGDAENFDATEFSANEYSVETEAEQLLEVEESKAEYNFPEYVSESPKAFEMLSYYEENADFSSPNEPAENPHFSENENFQEFAAPEFLQETNDNELENNEFAAENENSQFAEVVEYENPENNFSENNENMKSEFPENNEHSEPEFSANNVETAEFPNKNSFEVAETDFCPFCDAEKEKQAFKCDSCEAVLTLTDLEMLLGHQNAKQEVLGKRIQEMEVEKDMRGFDSDELRMLAIGQINMRNLRKGFAYLQDAVKLNPNNVMLSSQVNAMAIRLAEIEQQESIHSSMPRGKMILVVDDSATVRKLISSKLEKSGHKVTCAVDGIDALEKIREISPDLILLDITMPRMDGYQVCKLIRANEATKEVPIVMISGKDGFFDKVRGRMSGTTAYITKPFGPETLMKTVETYITQPYE